MFPASESDSMGEKLFTVKRVVLALLLGLYAARDATSPGEAEGAIIASFIFIFGSLYLYGKATNLWQQYRTPDAA